MQKKDIVPIQAMKLPALLPIQVMKLPALLTMQVMKLPVSPTPLPQDQMILVSGVGIVAVLAIGVFVCVFFAYNTFQPKFKKLTNDRSTAQHQQKKDQPPKRRPMLYILYNK